MSPERRYIEVLTPSPQTVTLFGNGVLAAVIDYEEVIVEYSGLLSQRDSVPGSPKCRLCPKAHSVFRGSRVSSFRRTPACVTYGCIAEATVCVKTLGGGRKIRVCIWFFLHLHKETGRRRHKKLRNVVGDENWVAERCGSETSFTACLFNLIF